MTSGVGFSSPSAVWPEISQKLTEQSENTRSSYNKSSHYKERTVRDEIKIIVVIIALYGTVFVSPVDFFERRNRL